MNRGVLASERGRGESGKKKLLLPLHFTGDSRRPQSFFVSLSPEERGLFVSTDLAFLGLIDACVNE